MQDARGLPLEVGSTVVIPVRITSIVAGKYHLINVETIGVMPGNEVPTHICGISPSQVYRSNDGAISSVATEQRDGKTYLV